MRGGVCPDKFRKFSFISQEIGNENSAFIDAGSVLPAFWLTVFWAGPAEEPVIEVVGTFEVEAQVLERVVADAAPDRRSQGFAELARVVTRAR